ncbi:MAG: transposase [Patescibacteria group bacterium]
MPSERVKLITNELYHISDRAVGDSVIFKDDDDHYRGIFSCYEFNNANPVNIWHRRVQRKKEKIEQKSLAGSDPANSNLIIQERNMLVEILVFCFMTNHIHLVLRQLKDDGISQFMQKIGGYTTYFNEKYDRKGHLFSRFKAVHIKSNEQLRTAFIYDHINPLSLVEPGWKESGIKNPKKSIKFLEEEYRWSSFFDYLGKKNFSSVTKRDFLLDLMGGEKGCRQAVRDWIKYKSFKDFGDMVLE